MSRYPLQPTGRTGTGKAASINHALPLSKHVGGKWIANMLTTATTLVSRIRLSLLGLAAFRANHPSGTGHHGGRIQVHPGPQERIGQHPRALAWSADRPILRIRNHRYGYRELFGQQPHAPDPVPRAKSPATSLYPVNRFGPDIVHPADLSPTTEQVLL